MCWYEIEGCFRREDEWRKDGNCLSSNQTMTKQRRTWWLIKDQIKIWLESETKVGYCLRRAKRAVLHLLALHTNCNLTRTICHESLDLAWHASSPAFQLSSGKASGFHLSYIYTVMVVVHWKHFDFKQWPFMVLEGNMPRYSGPYWAWLHYIVAAHLWSLSSLGHFCP